MALNKIKEWQLDLSGINAKIEAIGKPVNFKGRVDSVDQLPEVGTDGDFWYVGKVEDENKAEYVWFDGKWELLGSADFGKVYTKEEIDNKVIVIEADIDANADAIQKTRSDFMESDSELQQQINAHANELTTQKNDIDELGDQVAGIESKIPEGTSDTNPLINKQQLLDEEMDIREDMMESDSELQTQINALAEAIQGGGGGSVPDDVYTKSNLLDGKDIEIVPEPVEGGIDEYTLGVFHYDDTNDPDKNSVDGGADPNTYKNIYTTYSKFGSGSTSPAGLGINTSLTENSDWTVDGWYYFVSTYGQVHQGLGITNSVSANSTNNTLGVFFSYETASVKIYRSNVLKAEFSYAFNFGQWYHLATEKYRNTINVYINGELVLSYTGDDVTNFSANKYLYTSGAGGTREYEDELRFSSIARYKGQPFTPPTEAYRVAEPTGNMVVNYTGKAVDLSGKADTNLGNIPTNYDYVVESYQEGSQWYRVYKSGWLEQGGTSNQTAVFLKPFADTNYTITYALHTGAYTTYIKSKTETQTVFHQNLNHDWHAFGQGETPVIDDITSGSEDTTVGDDDEFNEW